MTKSFPKKQICEVAKPTTGKNDLRNNRPKESQQQISNVGAEPSKLWDNHFSWDFFLTFAPPCSSTWRQTEPLARVQWNSPALP